MEKKRTATVNSILDQDEKLVERLLTQCEVYGNKIVDRLIAQIKQTGSRNSLALRWHHFLSQTFEEMKLGYLAWSNFHEGKSFDKLSSVIEKKRQL